MEGSQAASPELMIPVAWLGRTSTDDTQDPTLSMPRQLRRCRAVLPPNWVIVAHYWDVESGRKDLDQRGHGTGHEQFAIPIPRDGGIQDLLEAAARQPRPFAAVICESIERVARRTYVGTQIEHQLEQAGVTLCAADEPDSATLGARKATPTLTRRVKQAVSEWYVLQMLELSREGTIEHTRQGWNIGKPPYGYLAEAVPHPVAARRAEGRTKHRLAPHPVQGPVVTQIFELRVAGRHGYDQIAERLNLDLAAHPAPEPTRPDARLGRWTGSAVREVLTNPKYTGYMVYNRRSTKHGNKTNPASAWVWSPYPVHEPLVTRERFEQAQAVAATSGASRAGYAPNSNPATRTSYLLRSFLRCTLCGNRMWGKTHPRGTVYYVCEKDKRRHADQPWYPDHPATVRLRADQIETLVHDFFTSHIHTNPATSDGTCPTDPAASAIRSLERQITALENRRQRLIEELELLDDNDQDPTSLTALRAGIHKRHSELTRQINSHRAELTALTGNTAAAHRPAQTIPATLAALPLEAQRAAFHAYQLTISYDTHTHTATIAATVNGSTITAEHAIDHPRPRNKPHPITNRDDSD